MLRIRELREENGVSRPDLAESLGISFSSLGNYERGERIPDADVIIKLAEYFHVSTDYLLGLSAYKNLVKSADFDVQRISKLTGLSEKAVSILRDLMELPENERIIKVLSLLIEHEEPPPKREDFDFKGTFGEAIEDDCRSLNNNFEMAHDYWSDNHALVLSRLANCISYSPDPDLERTLIELRKKVHDKFSCADSKNSLDSFTNELFREMLFNAVVESMEKFITIEGEACNGDRN